MHFSSTPKHSLRYLHTVTSCLSHPLNEGMSFLSWRHQKDNLLVGSMEPRVLKNSNNCATHLRMEKIVPTGNQPQVQDFSLLDKTLRSHLHNLWDCPSDFPVCDRFFPKLLSWGLLNYTRGLNLGSQQPLSSLNLPPSHILFLPFHHWFIPNFCGWNPCLSG